MAIDLTLRRTNASGPLLPSRFGQVLALLAQHASARTIPRGWMRGQELRLALDPSIDDEAKAGFLLDFAAQGARVRGTAHGPSAELLAWAFHTLASALKCSLHDELARADIAPTPEAHRNAAVDYLASYEAALETSRLGQVDHDDGREFLEWLAREEHIALAVDADVATLGAALPMEDARALYETLLDGDEADAVDDVFVSESELAALLRRFRAGRRPAG